MQDIEKYCIDVTSDNKNMLVPWYLMASYAYYEEDEPLISDSLFDKLANRLLSSWEDIEHRHKDLLNKEMLRAGTYIGSYPNLVK
jgi:NAD-dependent DNA ligase